MGSAKVSVTFQINVALFCFCGAPFSYGAEFLMVLSCSCDAQLFELILIELGSLSNEIIAELV